jgi:hypothetical protein
MAGEKRVEKSFEGPESKDIFDEVFGVDEEKKAAMAARAKKQRDVREREERKKEAKEAFAGGNEVEEKESPPEEQLTGEKASEKGKVKEKIKRIVLAKAREAAEKDETALPLDKEAGTIEEGTKERQGEESAKGAVEQQGSEKQAEKKKSAIKPELAFLETDENRVFIGRKKSVFQQYGNEAGLLLGRVEEEDLRGRGILLDSLNPHVVFVCGARGSGKSYVLGVIAEELALHNQNVGTIVVDPIGVFWSMRFPNKEKRELELLGKWGLLPRGLDNIKVFIPHGMRDKVPKKTFDATFSLPPSMLTPEDWCLTFGIERFSPSGLLLEKAIQKVKQGYKTKDGKIIKPKGSLFSLEELIACLRTDSELNSPEQGYKPDSIRALVSRFDAAKNWGVFDERGTPLAELSRENQLTIIDTSFLEDNVSALVIGILARRILAARKISTRKEAMNRIREETLDQLLEEDIPPTWLFIDEAHTLIPSGNVKTPASTSLIEYVKQGRQPGCSLVFATQQPSAIDTKVLSQLDIIISHKLVFDDDIKAVYKRTPTIIPKKYKSSNFIRGLPVGVALTGDRREETSRAFVMRIRPRMSQHEGREAETVERSQKLSKEEVLKLAVGMTYAKLEKAGTLETAIVDEAIRSLNIKYRSTVQLSEVIEQLERKGALLNPKTSTLSIPGKEHEEAIVEEISGEVEKEIAKESKAVLQPEPVELLAFPANLSMEAAKKTVNRLRKKKFLGLFGEDEAIEKISLRHLPLYRVRFNVFKTNNTFYSGEAFINSSSGEFIHFNEKKDAFVESKGLPLLNELKENEARAMFAIGKEKREFAAIARQIGETTMVTKRLLENLVAKGIAAKERVAGNDFYCLKREIDLPKNPLHPLLKSLERLPVSMEEALSIEMERVGKQRAIEAITKLWKRTVVKEVKDVYLPFYEAILKKPNGNIRVLRIEAVNGKIMQTPT